MSELKHPDQKKHNGGFGGRSRNQEKVASGLRACVEMCKQSGSRRLRPFSSVLNFQDLVDLSRPSSGDTPDAESQKHAIKQDERQPAKTSQNKLSIYLSHIAGKLYKMANTKYYLLQLYPMLNPPALGLGKSSLPSCMERLRILPPLMWIPTPVHLL